MLRICRIHDMEKAEIQQIATYLKDLEEGLDEWDYRGVTTLGDLNRLYVMIAHLMKATFETKDQDLKVLLASLEYQHQGQISKNLSESLCLASNFR